MPKESRPPQRIRMSKSIAIKDKEWALFLVEMDGKEILDVHMEECASRAEALTRKRKLQKQIEFNFRIYIGRRKR